MRSYTPSEDSYLLEAQVRKHAKGRVLDLGTGSGIQGKIALKSKKVTEVIATDIDKGCKKYVDKKIKFIHSDLFKKIPKQKFDTITFNPPYLPQDKGITDTTLYGGKKGYEVIERFLNTCNTYLSKNGIILLLFSSRSRKQVIDQIIENNCFTKEEISKENLPFFEQLYVYKIKKASLLKKLEKQHITNIEKFAKGKRGIIYTGDLNGKVAIKVKNQNSLAPQTIANETKWLRILNKHHIGPKLISSSKDYFVYRFVEGEFIIDFVKNSKASEIKKILRNLLQQCRTMDKLKVNKLEMQRPHKHAIIKSNPVLIDFERCKLTNKPKNTTQFCQFLTNGYFNKLLKQKHINIDKEKLLEAAKKYKKSQSDSNFNKISAMLQ